MNRTLLAHFRSGHIKTMKFSEGRKSFEMCTNCPSEPATFAHILECIGLTKQDLADVPLLVLDILKVAIRLNRTSAQVDAHNTAAFDRYRAKEERIFKLQSENALINATRKADNVNMNNIVSYDINKTGWLQKRARIFVWNKSDASLAY
ncbi:RNase H domain-containing protein [Trichonephila clavipes]|nr:RNase H domain-containing protein [Trichonephila clavipes]